MSAQNADFLGEGTAEPAQARPLTLVEQARMEEDARRRRLEAAKNSRLPYDNRYRDARRASDQQALQLSNDTVTRDRIARTGSARGNRQGLFANLADDPVTTGVLLGPLAVTGVGLAAGGPAALGVGLGEGTIAGGSLPAAVPQVTPLGSIASPFGPGSLGGGAAAKGAAGGAAAAGAGSGGGAAAGGWTAKDTVHTLTPLATWGATTLAERLIRGGGDDERKTLAAKQEQMARETQLRRQQAQQARMDALGNRMLAFDPFNQHLARMFGPEAAFKPEQLAALVENPMKPELDPELRDYRGTDDKKERQINDYMAAKEKYDAAEKARREKVMGGITPTGPAPAAFNMPAPMAARRY
jgi:hypothetical protein